MQGRISISLTSLKRPTETGRARLTPGRGFHHKESTMPKQHEDGSISFTLEDLGGQAFLDEAALAVKARLEAKFGPPIADYLTPEPAAAIPAIDAEVVRTVVRECGYVYDLRLGWVRPVGGLAASTTVTRATWGQPAQPPPPRGGRGSPADAARQSAHSGLRSTWPRRPGADPAGAAITQGGDHGYRAGKR
jgi:hypothetical protein